MEQSILEKFEACFDRRDDGGCWNWKASVTVKRGGYGQFRIQGTMVRAHRLSYKLYVGPVPDGMLVLHRCDNPRCVNPHHLFIGTHYDNMRDMWRKNRGNRHGSSGEKNGRSKLTKKDVQFIKSVNGPRGIQQRLAEEFGVSPTQVSAIRRGVAWK